MKLQNLPNELLLIIFQYVVEAPKDILKICGLCKRFYKLTMHHEHSNNKSSKFRRKENGETPEGDEILSYCIGSGARTPRRLKYNTSSNNLLEHKRVVHDEDVSIEKVLWNNVRRWSMEKYFEQVNKHSNIYSSIDPFRARAIDFSNNTLMHKLPLSIVFRKYFEPTYSQSILYKLNTSQQEASKTIPTPRERMIEPSMVSASTSSSPFATLKTQDGAASDDDEQRIRNILAELGIEQDLNLALNPNVHCVRDLQKHEDIPLQNSGSSPFLNFTDYKNCMDSLVLEEGVVSGVLQKFHLAKIRRSDLLNYSLLNTTVNVLLFLYVCALWSLGLADLRLIRWNIHATFLGFLFPLTNEFSVLYFAFVKNYYLKKNQTELKSHTQSLISITILFFAIWSWVSMLMLKVLDLIVPVEVAASVPVVASASTVQTISSATAALAKTFTESYFSTANHQCKSVLFPLLPSASQEQAASTLASSSLCDHWFVLTFPIIGLLMVCSLIEWQRIGMLEVQNNGVISIRLPNPNIELDDLAIGGFMIPTLAITLTCFSLSMDRIMSSLTDGLLLACLLVLIIEQAVVVFASLRKKRYLSGIVIGFVIWIEFNMIFGIGVSLLTMLPFLLLVVIAHALFLYSCKLGIIRRIASLFVGI